MLFKKVAVLCKLAISRYGRKVGNQYVSQRHAQQGLDKCAHINKGVQFDARALPRAIAIALIAIQPKTGQDSATQTRSPVSCLCMDAAQSI